MHCAHTKHSAGGWGPGFTEKFAQITFYQFTYSMHKFTSLTMVISCHYTFHRYTLTSMAHFHFICVLFIYIIELFFPFYSTLPCLLALWNRVAPFSYIRFSIHMYRIRFPCWYSIILQNHYGRIFGALDMWTIWNAAVPGTAYDVHCTKRIATEKDDNIWVNRYRISIIIECLKTFCPLILLHTHEHTHENGTKL